MLWGGDINWLTGGLKCCDKKLQRISELNELMAFRPWELGVNEIENLTKSTENDFRLNWSIHEILQAGAILAYYHSLCSFAYANGIKENLDSAMSFDKPCQNKSQRVREDEDKALNFLQRKKYEEDNEDFKHLD